MLRRPMDWFSTTGMVVIVMIVVGLVVYSLSTRPPTGAKMRIPLIGSSSE